jgi:hypothetical protein
LACRGTGRLGSFGRWVQGLFALAVLLIIVWCVVAVAKADARPVSFSVTRAEQAVVHYFGSGTTANCHRATPHSAICNYSTPTVNVGIEAEGASMWTGTCRAIFGQHGYRVSARGIE